MSGNDLSRRNFLKSGSLFALGKILFNDPVSKLLAEAYNLKRTSSGVDFSCELFRGSDMLYLKYYFFNAELKGRKIVRAAGAPLYIYIKIPSQHIGEEILTEEADKFSSFTDFKKQKSYLAKSSWLAFKLTDQLHSIKYNAEELLNWKDNFDLLTIDDFAKQNDSDYFSSYDTALTSLKNNVAVAELTEEAILYPDYNNVLKPLTTFEVPFKMWLSPIGYPMDNPPAGQIDLRSYGEYFFSDDNSLKFFYSESKKKKRINIVAAWENSLVYRNSEGVFPPRFKVVRAICQDCSLPEPEKNLLPAPINREELKELSMRPAYDRDVRSGFFKISSLGATTNLKYKNDDPDIFSLVAWEQKIKTGRDNYVSVTFRAIDVFTGLKLLISIVAERNFNQGVSYLQKRYHIAFAEQQKTYTDTVIVSRVPFVKIIPKTIGAYFYPQSFGAVDPSKNTKGSYLVSKSKPAQGNTSKNVFDNYGNILDENLLEFDYTGIDKAGTEHHFRSKIIFIPAEIYEITSGVYQYTDDNGAKKQAPAGTIIDMQDVGELNPANDIRLNGSVNPGCKPCETDNYKFKLVKVFAAANSTRLQIIISGISGIIATEKYRNSFGITIKNELSYARITELKKLKLIRADSTNATFKTKSVLFVPEYNTALNGTDFYFDNFPLLPVLKNADVVISQIDQIQGKSQYHRVRYFEDYRNSNKELDQPAANKALLFFELEKDLNNFFTENKKNSGAIVNPGIQVTHISALNNSISYNQTHNRTNNRDTAVAGGFTLTNSVSGTSVFRELKAEILGISLVDILENTLSVDDLPVFAYANQLEQTIQRIKELQREFSSLTDGWVGAYNKLISDIADEKAKLESLQETARLMAKQDIRAWMETAIELSGAAAFYQRQIASLQDSSAELINYRQKCLDPIKAKITSIVNRSDFNLQITVDSFFANPTVAGTIVLIQAIEVYNKKYPGVFQEKYLKESIKISLIIKIQNADTVEILQNYTNLVKEKAKEGDAQFTAYYQEVMDGMQEALDFSVAAGAHYQEKISERLHAFTGNIPDFIISQLIEINRSKNAIQNWMLPFFELTKLYDDYNKYLDQLKEEYYSEIARNLLLPLTANDFQASVGPIAAKLQMQLAADIKNIKNGKMLQLVGAPPAIDSAFAALLSKLSENGVTIQNYEKVSKDVKKVISDGLKAYENEMGQLYSAYRSVLKKIEIRKAEFARFKKEAENFIPNILKNLESELYQAKNDLIDAGKASTQYRKAEEQIAGIEKFLNKIKSLSHQKLDYNFNTNKFRRASLGGVVEFLPEHNKTELAVNVSYQIELNIVSLGGPPSISRQSHVTDSSLTNFKIGLLQLLYIDFERVRFVSGSDVKDDFHVQIRNVEFAGFLSFFQVFQEYLKSLSDDIVFDISPTEARIGYGLTIPDVTAGAFNFFNLSLTGMIVLPFQPNKSMQLEFGIGSDLNKFGLTVMAIFGGQGYFNIIAEPKRGIVGMIVVLEFGAIFNLNLGVARGTVYLVGGIYIRDYNGKFDLRGYILCVGRMRILALFSASVTFYLGLEGNSQVLQGRCRVTVSHRFSRFFEVSVSFEMTKVIKGTKTTETENPDTSYSALANDANLKIADTNLYKNNFYKDESIKVIIKPEANQQNLTVTMTDDKQNSYPVNLKAKGNLKELTVALSGIPTGNYELTVASASGAVKKVFTVANHESYEECPSLPRTNNEINITDYYASYF